MMLALGALCALVSVCMVFAIVVVDRIAEANGRVADAIEHVADEMRANRAQSAAASARAEETSSRAEGTLSSFLGPLAAMMPKLPPELAVVKGGDVVPLRKDDDRPRPEGS